MSGRPSRPVPVAVVGDGDGPGRHFQSSRRVRLGDVDPTGGARLDAVARYLQDVAGDDMRDAGFADEVAWVVRRTTLVVCRRPMLDSVIGLRTWCSATGPCWAERRTRITDETGTALDAATLWVAIDRRSSRPAALSDAFFERYGPAAGGRRVSSRLSHSPARLPCAEERPWPVRSTDFDVLGHLNNAVVWAAVEDELNRSGWVPTPAGPVGDGRVLRAEAEYRSAVQPGEELTLSRAGDGEAVWLWLSAGGETKVSVWVRSCKP